MFGCDFVKVYGAYPASSGLGDWGGLIKCAMDEAREADPAQKKQLKELSDISPKVAALSTDDKQVKKGIEKLKT